MFVMLIIMYKAQKIITITSISFGNSVVYFVGKFGSTPVFWQSV